MHLNDLEQFYNDDEKKYELINNKDFLKWFNNINKVGYPKDLFTIENLQQLIDFITNWYEIKYPNRLLQKEKGYDVEPRFKNYQDRTTNLDMDDLLYQLPPNLLAILDCNYRGGFGFDQVIVVNDKGEVVGKKPRVYLSISQIVEGNMGVVPILYIAFNPTNGELYDNYAYEEYFNEQETLIDENISRSGKTIYELYYYLRKKYQDELDLSELENILFINNCDKKIRKNLLNLVALKLIYSKNTIPEYGFMRANNFIDEFNSYYLNNKGEELGLSTNEIDEIINLYLMHKIKVKANKKWV